MPAFTETFAERFERAETLVVRAPTGASAADLDGLIDATIGVICARPD